jgi:hypothetical protein
MSVQYTHFNDVATSHDVVPQRHSLGSGVTVIQVELHLRKNWLDKALTCSDTDICDRGGGTSRIIKYC